MNKRENLTSGTKYGNPEGENAFIGSRLESKNRVSTFTVDVPFTDSVSGLQKSFKVTFKTSVDALARPVDYAAALGKTRAYLNQEVGTLEQWTELSSGMIETVIDDILTTPTV